LRHVDASAVASLESRPFIGSAWRRMSPRRDPLSGEGARIHGGRFNPPESFAVLYLCLSRSCAVAEFKRMASRQIIGPEGLLRRRLYTYRLELARIIDLCDESVLQALDMSASDLVDEDRRLAREIGVIAYDLGLQAVLCPSATGVGDILAVFSDHLGASVVRFELAEEWTSLEQIDWSA
jgi:RES domain-containing protein